LSASTARWIDPIISEEIDLDSAMPSVPDVTVASIAISLGISVSLPVALFAYYRIRQKISPKVVLAGALVWVVFVLVLERLLHSVVVPVLSSQPLAFAVYAAVAAGVFEEGGRYIVFTRFLKAKREWKDGMAYGIGHGGVESFVIGALASAQILVLALMINSGSSGQIQGLLGADIASAITQSLEQPPLVFLLGGIERAFALSIQIALSMLVLYGLAKGRGLKYLLLAIAFHAGVDFVAALYQIRILELVTTELIIGIFASISTVIIYLTMKFWPQKTVVSG
jgi:uncharacterized membrane protein YhfC